MTPPLFFEAVVARGALVLNVAVGSLDAEIAPTVVPPPAWNQDSLKQTTKQRRDSQKFLLGDIQLSGHPKQRWFYKIMIMTKSDIKITFRSKRDAYVVFYKYAAFNCILWT